MIINTKLYTLLFSLLGFLLGMAQTTVKGSITDKSTGKPLSGVQIFFNDRPQAALTTADSTFEITADTIIYQLKFVKPKYQPETLIVDSLNANNLAVSLAALQDKVTAIDAVNIERKKIVYKNKRENPAYAIMQEVFKRKRNNGLDKFKTFRYREYEKIELGLENLDSTFAHRKIFNNMEFVFKYGDSVAAGKLELPLYLTETLYENVGENVPAKRRQKITLAEKVSGLENNQLISGTAKNFYRDIDIYQPTINYFDIGFQSPVSENGFSTYDYFLTDTITVRGQEAYRIEYSPKRKDVLALQGVLLISTKNYAVLHATLKSTKKMNVNFVNGFSTELDFDNPDEESFLPVRTFTEIHLTIASKAKDAKGIISRRTVGYTGYVFDEPIPAEKLERPKVYTTSELKKDDAFWQNARSEELSESEKSIYTMMERLEKNPKFNFLIDATEVISSGFFNVGNAIDIGNLYYVYGKNEVEGNRIRLDARTYFSRDDDWRIKAYLAYGFKDENFKYGAEAKYMFDKTNRFTIGAAARRDILQLGTQLTTDEGIMSRTFATSQVFGRGENSSLSRAEQFGAFVSVEPWKNIILRLDGTSQNFHSANPEKFSLSYYKNGGLKDRVYDSRLTMSMIARPGAVYSQTGVERTRQSNLSPTIMLKYSHGFDGILQSDFNYDKLQIFYDQPILTGSFGQLQLDFEAGKNFAAVPLAIQSVIPGNQSYSIVQNTFSQLNYYEFVADTYATLHLEQHFNGKLLSFIPLIKKLKFREVAFFRTAYGSLSEGARRINEESTRYSAPDKKPYFEYGFGIENIGFGNLRLLRFDFTWRGNYLERPDISKFGIKFGLQFSY